MPFILGPVIGHIKNDTVYILYEVDIPSLITIKLISNTHTLIREIHSIPGKPITTSIEGLLPDIRYKVLLESYTDSREGTFITTPSRIHIVSCNNPYKGTMKAWDFMLFPHRKKCDVCIHIGDQIYNDYGSDTYSKTLTCDTYNEMVNVYREAYRHTWSLSHMREILSSCSNIMIGDDHDIVDSWDQKISIPDDWQNIVDLLGWEVLAASYHDKEKMSIIAALQAYSEYQLSLSGIKYPGSFMLEVAGKRVLLLDLRISRSTKSSIPLYRDIDIIISPVPVFFLSDIAVNKVTAKILDILGQKDINDMWNFHKRDIDIIGLMMRDNPHCILISGDSHMCGKSDIIIDNNVYKQYVTSGICTPVPPKILWMMLLLSRKFSICGIDVRHKYWVRSNNYLSIDVHEWDINIVIPELLE